MLFSDIGASFLLGLLTPLTAVCVLPLYPAFLAYLSNQFDKKASKKSYALLGLTITLGVIAFMLILGLLFTTLLQVSLTNVIGIVSPIAFGILGLISLLLIFNVDFSKYIPKPKTYQGKKPLTGAFFYGFFFGAIVLPCNPAFIAAFFARALIVDSVFVNMLNFLGFGLGLGAPLLVFSLISVNYSQKVIGWLVRWKRQINLIAGLLMLGISIYYLFFVFRIFNL